jgi:hypothetical protein
LRHCRTPIQSTKLLDMAESVVDVIEYSRGFTGLEEEWEDLHRQCPRRCSRVGLLRF